MTIEHTVLWNGRREGPGGRQLFTEEEQRVGEPEPDRRRGPRAAEGDVREVVLAQLQQQSQTMRELAAATGFALERINSALYALRLAGRVRVAGEKPRAGSAYGRTIESVYGITR